jgi:hypothetical protein
MNPVVRVVRIVQIAIIVSVLMFIFVLHTIHPPPHTVNASLQWAIAFCAIVSALVGFIMQRKILNSPDPPTNALGQTSNPQGRWFTGHIIRFATAESVALFGFVLRMLGSSSTLVYLLFGSSLLLLILWQPGAIPTQTESQSSIG